MVSVGASTVPSNEEDMNKPLWNYVTRYGKIRDGGGNISWQCNFCSKVSKSSYTRVKAHLLRLPGQGIKACPNVTAEDILEMQNLDVEAKSRLNSSTPKRVPLPPPVNSLGGMSAFAHSGYDSKKRKTSASSNFGGSGNAHEKTFDMVARDELHSIIAKMFYSAGLPFQLARNPYFVSSYTWATKNTIPRYVPPGYNMLRTTLLQKEKENIIRQFQPFKDAWKEKGVSIVSDGWNDSRLLINFMAVTDGKPMFLKAVNCSSETKDKYFIANVITEIINEVGHENVVQVITENSPNCEGAGQIIEAQFSNIAWTPCVVHSLNLALKNICETKNVENDQFSWILDVIKDVMQIKNFIVNHPMRLEIFKEFVTLKLLFISDTHFASAIVMLRRFKLVKHGLQSMVISERWSCYRKNNVGTAKFMREKVLDDTWWDSVDYMLSIMAPIYDMLRACNTYKPCLHLVYDMWDTMIENVKTAVYSYKGKSQSDLSTFYDLIHRTLVDLWNKNNTELHCLAYCLNPRYYTNEWLDVDNNRVPPYRNPEVSQKRQNCLTKYFKTIEDRTKFNIEYANFVTKSGAFGDYDSIHGRYYMDPVRWWVIHGAHAPMLQSLALKLLVHPSSSSCCERNWSTYTFVHEVRMNKLTPQRALDLVFVHNNLRLLSRETPEYMQGETRMWDVGGDAFDSFEGLGFLEIANLSLDEPELEAFLFKDDGDVGDDDEAVEVGSNRE